MYIYFSRPVLMECYHFFLDFVVLSTFRYVLVVVIVLFTMQVRKIADVCVCVYSSIMRVSNLEGEKVVESYGQTMGE